MTSKQKPKPYTQWIHCNVCYKAFIKKEHRFYLLACHHITCEPCIVGLEQNVSGPHVYKCPVCHKITKACEINNTMPKNLKELFHPHPYMDGVNNFQIMNFQDKHRLRYLVYRDMVIAKKKELRRIIEKSKEGTQKTYKEYEEIKAERKHLEKRARLIRQQRRDIDGNRSNKSLSSSSSGRSSSTGPKGSPTNSDYGVTSFSNLAPTHSFLL